MTRMAAAHKDLIFGVAELLAFMVVITPPGFSWQRAVLSLVLGIGMIDRVIDWSGEEMG